MKIENIAVNKINPYSGNAKKHDQIQIDNVAESIRQFGFVQPIVIDKNNECIIGHCRLEASKKLELKEVPCLRLENLNDEQIKKLRVLDNKLNESEWDFELLDNEIRNLDFTGFNLDFEIDNDLQDFDIGEQNGDNIENINSRNAKKSHICPSCGYEFFEA